ncbi:MAG: hypothetical protein J7647_18635 [Cyanobacteria bacterium SBLK]|nr:hypothetical protein [Cyanobacteria bacterium SBLK]
MNTVLNVQTAVQIAINYFKTIQNDLGDNIQDIRLEEVEISDDDKSWFITLGYDDPKQIPYNPILPDANYRQYERTYKIFEIAAETGKVKSMKIRKI